MSEKFSEAVKRCRAEAAEARKPHALSDLDMVKVAGGVGGENEATCPKCGKPMRATGQEFGDGFWVCDRCKVNQICSDAEFIEIVRYMESINYPGIEYPVWWDMVK